MIDLHAHVVPDSVPFDVGGAGDWPRLVAGRDIGDVFLGGRHFRRVDRIAWDLERRAEELEARAHRQVLSVMPELFCYWAPPRAAADYCRSTNDWLVKAVADRDCFDAFGIVPLQQPDRAASMLPAMADAGLRGVAVGSNVEGVPLYDPRFESLFAAAAELGMIVFAHAFHPPRFSTLPDAATANAVTFPTEIGEIVAGLVGCGVLQANPRLRLLASHGAGSVSILLPRLDMAWELGGPLAERLVDRPSIQAQRLWVDPLLYSTAALRLLVDTLGRDSIVAGTDAPFLPPPSWPSVASAFGVGEAEALAILDQNARALLGSC
jgi:aminocarboxymuconate-semialdehyde decarboxylase